MNSLKEYLKLWFKLDELFDNNQGESELADQIRDKMDLINVTGDDKKFLTDVFQKIDR